MFVYDKNKDKPFCIGSMFNNEFRPPSKDFTDHFSNSRAYGLMTNDINIISKCIYTSFCVVFIRRPLWWCHRISLLSDFCCYYYLLFLTVNCYLPFGCHVIWLLLLLLTAFCYCCYLSFVTVVVQLLLLLLSGFCYCYCPAFINCCYLACVTTII